MKKIISFILAAVILSTAVVCVLPSAIASEDGTTTPIVHVVGTGTPILRYNEAGERETVYPLQIPDGYIEEKAEIFLPVFADAFFTQEWDEFCDVLYECVSPIFNQMSLDKNGNVSDGSFVDWDWSKEDLANHNDGLYSATEFKFHYDWRLDPFVTADTLHQYIEDVMEATGSEKVALYGRCLGSNMVAAYMKKYDGEYVSEVIHYASAAYGATQCSKMFTGELFLHADGIERFIYDTDLGLEEYLTDLIESLVTLMNKTYGLDIACWAVNNVVQDIYLDIFPRIVGESYGTFPAYWSMVSLEDYDRAMETMFYGKDISEYAELISKIENYHNNVRLTFEDDVKAFEEKGIEFSNIVKYGYQSIPVTENSNELSDQLVTVRESSFGATALDVGKTFDDEYIRSAVTNSTAKYISPDKQIDASTCLSPDKTWFVKNLKHADFPDCINGLVSDIVNNENFNIYSNSEYPQYLVYKDDTSVIVPMTAENMNTTGRWETLYFDSLIKFFKAIFTLVENKLSQA
ncbi:MAG: hypothetical protein IKK63_01920 [Clostridia bacterium]|nr:hypothetical protein [Clostridia bacterium]